MRITRRPPPEWVQYRGVTYTFEALAEHFRISEHRLIARMNACDWDMDKYRELYTHWNDRIRHRKTPRIGDEFVTPWGMAKRLGVPYSKLREAYRAWGDLKLCLLHWNSQTGDDADFALSAAAERDEIRLRDLVRP